MNDELWNALMQRAPALNATVKINEPKPETLRACIMELTRHVLRLEKRIIELEKEQGIQ